MMRVRKLPREDTERDLKLQVYGLETMLRYYHFVVFFFSSRRRHTRFDCDWSSDVCSSDLPRYAPAPRTSSGGAAPERTSAASTGARRGPWRCGRVGAGWRSATTSPVWPRSEERRVGEECRSRWSPYH